MSHPPTTPQVDPSLAEVWLLKDITFHGKDLRIITQNFNGPCSFIAICNILILRGNIEIQPPERQNVSYEFLSQLVADYLLHTSPDVDVSAALSIMPKTQKGMDLNPVFTSATSFHPSGLVDGGGGELKLFQQVGIPLLHGWLVDPDSPEAPVLARVGDYDSAVALIAEADHLTNGHLVADESSTSAGTSASAAGPPVRVYTDEERRKISDATTVRHFLDTTQSQLTYHGLFHLAATLPPNVPCALFRSSHLAVVYKHAPAAAAGGSPSPSASAGPSSSSSSGPGPSSSAPAAAMDSMSPHDPPPASHADPSDPFTASALYTLATDHVFAHEPAVVWERLEDVDGASSAFVDSAFARASPAGGDYAGQTAAEALRRAVEEAEGAFEGVVDPADLALARQLQAEEEQIAQQAYMEEVRAHEQQQQARQEQAQRQLQIEQDEKEAKLRSKKKGIKKGDCIVM